jgi:hypothetical protein
MAPPRVLLQVKTRDDAIALIEKIAVQGEGLTSSDPSDESHYKRFRAIYDKFPEDGDWKDSEGKPVQPAREVPTNPNTTPGPAPDPSVERDQEMLPNILGISGLLVRLPLRKEDAVGPPFAGPTFEMDYTLALPDREPDRWRLHRDLIIATQMLTKRIREEGHPDEDQKSFLNDLESTDTAALKDVIEPQIKA